MPQDNLLGSSSVSLAACYQLVAHCPTLICMLQALWLLNDDDTYNGWWVYRAEPMFIQLLLDLSWDDLTTDLSVLRSLIGGGTQRQLEHTAMMIIPTMLALSVEVYPNSITYLTVKLARGVLHLIQQVGGGRIPFYNWRDLVSDHHDFRLWGQLIRHSPHCLELLRDLREFDPHWDVFCSSYCHFDCLCAVEFYHVVQWLKGFPNPSADVLDVLERWQGYLQKSREFCLQVGCIDKDFEHMWPEGMGVTSIASRYNRAMSKKGVLPEVY
ncbi:hypothetical protein DFH06DRAFT_1463809 [Mycena polygramma]|nr:hypothetical protein DFH06DRAFT_1463809 [Mycena polygramma]